MANSSIHIQRAVSGSVGHNSREHFSHSIVFTDEKNECSTNIDEAYKTYRTEVKIRTDAYTERKGQKLQKTAVTQLSAVINLEAHHTLKDLEPIKAELERLFDTKVYQIAIHRDEGKLVSKEDGTEFYSGKDFFLNPKTDKLYFDKKFTKPVPMENYQIVKNYHAHMEMLGLDSKGNAIRQKMNKVALQGLQTTVAKTLQMERGKPRESYTKKEMEQILKVVGKKSDYENTTLYAQKFSEVAKELGIFKDNGNKRKDTPKFKDQGAEREKGKREALAVAKELESEQSLGEKYDSLPIKKRLEMRLEMREILGENIELKSLKEELKALKEAQKLERSKLQSQGATRADYAIMEAKYKAIELELKALKETKSTPAPKGENEASRQIERYIEEMPKSATVQLKTDELDVVRFENGAEAKEAKYRYGDEYAEQIVKKHTNFVGKIDKEALIKELGTEFKETASVLNRGLVLVNDFKSAYEKTKSGLNSALKSTEKAFKDVFSKITGKSTTEVQNERIEQERAIREQQFKEREEQRAKEPKVKAPSRGLSLG